MPTDPIQPFINALTYSKIRVTFKALSHIVLDDQYNGSAFRGSVLRAYMNLKCRMHNTKIVCSNCPSIRSCTYSRFTINLLEPTHPMYGRFTKPPEGFVVNPPDDGKNEYESGELFSIEITLFGDGANKFYPSLSESFRLMGENGIGPGRGSFTPVSIDGIDEKDIFTPLYQYAIPKINHLKMRDKLKINKSVTIQFINPLQLKGVVLTPDSKPDLNRLMNNLSQRIQNIALLYCEYRGRQIPFQPKYKEDFVLTASDINTVKFLSHSAQRFKQHLAALKAYEGLTGTATFTGELKPWASLLQAGEILQAGSLTTFGLGRYKIIDYE